MAAKPPVKFEEALKRLEEIVEQMEQDVDLEKSLVLFEEGIKLVRFCSSKLEEAKKKVEVLVKKGDKLSPEPFDPEKESNDKELF
jgi:exodeoxyribonuclease VII small subunit